MKFTITLEDTPHGVEIKATSEVADVKEIKTSDAIGYFVEAAKALGIDITAALKNQLSHLGERQPDARPGFHAGQN